MFALRSGTVLSPHDEREVAMTMLRFLREMFTLVSLLGTLYAWTLFGHALGL